MPYYLAVNRNGRTSYSFAPEPGQPCAGPYATRDEADVAMTFAMQIAEELDPWSWFWTWGTAFIHDEKNWEPPANVKRLTAEIAKRIATI